MAKKKAISTEDFIEKGKKTQFSKSNQPDPKAKSEGWAKKRLLKDIASEILTGGAKENLSALATYFGIDVETVDVETAMHLRQIEKAVKDGNTFAYNAVMDRLKGKPVQAIQTEVKSVKPIIFKTIETPQNGKD